MTSRTWDDANLFQRSVRQIASSRPGSWLFSRSLHHVDAALERLTRARWNASELLAGVPTGMLTTTGARTGRPRTVPLLAFAMDGGWGVISSNWGDPKPPAWAANLRAHADAHFEVDGVEHAVVARRLTGADRARLRRLALSFYRGYAEYEKRAGGRDLGFFLLTPVPS